MKGSLKTLLIACLIIPVAVAMVACGGKATKYTITATSSNIEFGTVTGAGKYTKDADVTLSAMTKTGYTFMGWNVGTETVSIANPYTFKAMENKNIVGVFAATTVTTVTISVSSNDEDMGTATGAGEFAFGGNVTLTAIPVAGYELVGWKVGTEIVSTVNPYKFIATGNLAVVAVFDVEIIPLVGSYAFAYVSVYGVNFTSDDIDDEYEFTKKGAFKVIGLMAGLSEDVLAIIDDEKEGGETAQEWVEENIIATLFSAPLINMTFNDNGTATSYFGSEVDIRPYFLSGLEILFYDGGELASKLYWDSTKGTITMDNAMYSDFLISIIFEKVIS